MRILWITAAAVATTLSAAPIVYGETTPSLTGTVERYLLTPHGEVEGLLLSDGTTVQFPPHLGTALASTVRPGDAVTVIGFLGPVTPQGRAIRALSILNARSGQTIVDQPPATSPLPPDMRGLTLTALTVTGTVARLVVNDHGDVDGLILHGGEEVKLKPHTGTLVAMVLGQHPGEPVEASGVGTRNSFGTVVDAMSVTVAGQAIPLEAGPGPGSGPR
jgi:hypothetical protein